MSDAEQPLFCPCCGRPTGDPTENRDGLARRDGPETMKEAARRVAPRTGSQRWRVLTFVMQRGSATDDELEVGLGLAHQTASARRNELTTDGYLRWDGERRKTRRRADARVWIPTPLARAWIPD